MNVVTLLTPSEAPMVAAATFVFTDVVDSTEHAMRLGDERWAVVLRDHIALVRDIVEAHGGIEGSFLGDGFLLLFCDPSAALDCAITLQHAFRRFRGTHPDAPLEVRVGLHAGMACRDGRDVYGPDIHLASRVAMQAEGGEVVLSQVAYDAVATEVPPVVVRRRRLKGLPGPHRLHVLRVVAG